MELLQCIASLPGGTGQWNLCNALPHCLGAVGSATPPMHCHTAWGPRAVELLQCAAHQLGGSHAQEAVDALRAELLQCTATLPVAVGGGTLVMRCLTAWGQRAVELLLRIASLLGGSGLCNSYNALPHCLGAVGSGSLAMRGPTGTGSPAQEALTAFRAELLQCTATLLGRSGQWNSCHALPHCLGAVGSGPPPMRGPTNSQDGECCPGGCRCPKSELLKCIAKCELPHYLGAVGHATPATHCHTA